MVLKHEPTTVETIGRGRGGVEGSRQPGSKFQALTMPYLGFGV